MVMLYLDQLPLQPIVVVYNETLLTCPLLAGDALLPLLLKEARSCAAARDGSYLTIFFLCASPPAVAAGPNATCHKRISPLCGKARVYNYTNIIVICLTLPKMSITACWSIRAVGKYFRCPRERARPSWRSRGRTAAFPTKAGRGQRGQQGQLGYEKIRWVFFMLKKHSFSLLQQLPGTEEASRAEAGSQRKVNSEINELGKGNREKK